MNDPVLKIPVRCPACKAPPRLRSTELLRQAASTLPPTAPIVSYQCHRSECNTIYPITAGELVLAA